MAKSRLSSARAPVIVLIIGVLLTLSAARLTQQVSSQAEALAFDRLAERVQHTIEERLLSHARALAGLRGLYLASEQLTQTEFGDYVSELALGEAPGALGYGFIRYVHAADLARYERQQRALNPAFEIKGPLVGDQRFVVELVAPLSFNRAAIGVDLHSEERRRQAAEEANARNLPTLTRAITLVQDQLKQRGFLLLLPVYRGHIPTNATRAERMRYLIGWVYAPIRADKLLDGIDQQTDDMIDFELFEDDPSVAANLLYDADDHLARLESGRFETYRYGDRRQSRLVEMRVAGRDWFLRVSSNQQFERSVQNDAALVVLSAGLVITLLVAGLFATSARISRRAQALAGEMTASLRRSEQDMREVVRQLEQQKLAMDAHSIVAITDTQGTINYANARFCGISGYAESELIGHNHRLLNSGVHPKSFFREMYRTIAQGRLWHGEICNRAKDGHLYWVDTTIVPFFNAADKPVLYVAIRTDITAHKRAQEELRVHRDQLQDIVAARTADLESALTAAQAANRAKSEFISNVSHELRTPMHGILALADLGKRKTPELAIEKVVDYFERIHGAANRLMRLVNDILDPSKLDAGKMQFEFKSTALLPLIGEALKEMEAQATVHQQQLQWLPSSFVPVLHADGFRLMQVVCNLLSNAMKFSPDGSAIRISCHPDALVRQGQRQPAVRVEVSDAGVGIPEDELERIFDYFAQSSKTKSGAGGTGLGLAICRQIVQAHGGWIKARNNAGGGATVEFVLPLASVAP